MHKKIGPPRLIDTFFEAARTTAEFWASQFSHRALKVMVPEGYGAPVLVLPGLGGGDLTTKVLRSFLKDVGYCPYGWGNGINTGPDAQTMAHLKSSLEEIYAKHGGQKVALVGHSLGGIYARELARAFPQKVSMVVTLGSPFGAGEHPEATSKLVRKFFEFFNGRKNAFSEIAMARQSLTPPPVPTTAVYTQHDGVVHWRTCINPVADKAENVEVRASHCGLVVNPAVMLVIADRLAQDVSQGAKRWRPFEAMKYGLTCLFPLPQAHWGQEPILEKGAGRKPTIKLFPDARHE